MKNVILILVLLLLIGYAVLYIYRSKKKGKTCIGCPSGGNCAGDCQGCHFHAPKDPEK